MAFPQKLLSEGEVVILHTRTHWKALVWPSMILIATAAVGGYLLSVGAAWLTWATLIVAAIVIALFVLRPFLRWVSSTDTLTNRRLITRSGVINRVGRDIPLWKINDVTINRGLLDRIVGCGTITVESAGERGQIVLHDVPDAETLHLKLQEQLLQINRGDGLEPRRE
jgi:membrane protein YdbS with pleckstrin-like domain